MGPSSLIVSQIMRPKSKANYVPVPGSNGTDPFRLETMMKYEAKQAVYMPTADVLNLELHLLETRPGVQLDTFITELVKRWLTVDMERAALHKHGPSIRGVQWQTVFLPHGTRLRTRYRELVEFAEVRGDQIVSDDGARLTPSVFANRHAKGRNAWRFIWLRFPGNDDWTRADTCRRRVSQAEG